MIVINPADKKIRLWFCGLDLFTKYHPQKTTLVPKRITCTTLSRCSIEKIPSPGTIDPGKHRRIIRMTVQITGITALEKNLVIRARIKREGKSKIRVDNRAAAISEFYTLPIT
jgi:hypothetical protein